MGTTYIHGCEGHSHPGFWIDDNLIEIWLRLLVLNLEIPGPGDDKRSNLIRKMRDQWLIASSGGWNGCVPHSFDEYTSDELGLEIIGNAVEEISRGLNKWPGPFSVGALNLMGTGNGLWLKDIDSWRLKAVTRSFLNFLAGRYDPEKPDDMPGRGDAPVEA